LSRSTNARSPALEYSKTLARWIIELFSGPTASQTTGTPYVGLFGFHGTEFPTHATGEDPMASAAPEV